MFAILKAGIALITPSWRAGQPNPPKPSLDEQVASVINSVNGDVDKQTLKQSSELLAKIFSVSPNQKELVDPVKTLLPVIHEWIKLSARNCYLESQLMQIYKLHSDQAFSINPKITVEIGQYIAELSQYTPFILLK